jgi:hypothetical protein
MAANALYLIGVMNSGRDMLEVTFEEYRPLA